jgi:2-dehydro-3-deoxygluconokinase
VQQTPHSGTSNIKPIQFINRSAKVLNKSLMKQKIACLGELLLRLNPPNHNRFAQAHSFDINFAGSEANVALALAHWGVPAKYITCLPDNEIGRMALRSLKKFDVDTSDCLLEGERIGILYLEMGVGARASKVVYDRTHSSMATLQKGRIDWRAVLGDVSWLHWSGITPAISEAASGITQEALEAARALGIMVSCDLNYRSNLWKWGKQPFEIMPELLTYCDVVVGDGDTNALYFGIKNGDYKDVAIATMKCFPALKYVALTARKTHHASHHRYQGYLYDGVSFSASGEYNIETIIDRIGTGDAFMAGLIYGLMAEKGDKEYALQFAAASAALKHTVYGDYNLVSKAEIESLINGDTGGKVAR